MTSTERFRGVPSVERLLDVVEFFARTREPATLSTIAASLEVPRSSCLAILNTLVNRGYLYEIAPRQGYYPTRRWLEKFESIGRADPLDERVRRVLGALREKTTETIVFARRADLNVVYLDVLESEERLRYAAQPGQLLPLHATASGKAILAFYPEPLRSRLLRGSTFSALTPRTLADRDTLLRDVEAGIRRGYHMTDGETVEGLTGIATCAPLEGEPYALVIGGPSFRVRSRIDEYARLLTEACATLAES